MIGSALVAAAPIAASNVDTLRVVAEALGFVVAVATDEVVVLQRRST